ncbi:MAG: hypothetical protein KIT16_13515, partial [Rhodospirillaceae bacterium]|nr:hypothetical protein [Rhodospirillaceae bacterium]
PRAKPVVARDRSAAAAPGLRKPDLLPPEEIRAAIAEVVRAGAGAARHEIAPAVARRLGFAATGAALRERIEAEIAPLLAEGALAEQGSLLVVPARTASAAEASGSATG